MFIKNKFFLFNNLSERELELVLFFGLSYISCDPLNTK
jgi:hypothetical protein